MERSSNISRMVVLSVLLAGCGGGGGGGGSPPPPSPPPTLHSVSLSWQANREAAVNSAGGGYLLSISGQAPINCPFSGYVPPCTSPTSVQVSLYTGSYTVTVAAYSAVNGPGSTTGSRSAPSVPLTVVVP